MSVRPDARYRSRRRSISAASDSTAGGSQRGRPLSARSLEGPAWAAGTSEGGVNGGGPARPVPGVVATAVRTAFVFPFNSVQAESPYVV